jgi:archaeal type IV pilus assembly protein PilA
MYLVINFNMTKWSKPYLNYPKKRGVALVISHLLLVAIAVIGGTIIFSFSEGFFSSAQISGSNVVESLTIVGYDARALPELQSHDGNYMAIGSGGNSNKLKEFNERIAIYITSNTPQTIAVSEIVFGGVVYNYTTILGNTISNWDEAIDLTPGKYSILTKSPDMILFSDAPRIKPGQSVTFLIDLEDDLRLSRGTQFKMTTTNGGVFVGTINIGHQVG